MFTIIEGLKAIFKAITIEDDKASFSDSNRKVIEDVIKAMNKEMLLNYSEKCNNVKLLLNALDYTKGGSRRRRRSNIKKKKTRKKRGSRKNKK